VNNGKVSEILKNDNEHIYQNLKDLSSLENSTILVTGSSGFLGKTVISFLNFLNETKLEKNKNQINIIALDYEDHDICKPMGQFISADTVDYIINCAGIASPKKYLKKPVETLDVSYLGTKNIFELAQIKNTKSILMFSSSEVYGTPDTGNIPTKEKYIGSVTTFGNRSCYDIGKNVLESLCYVYYTKHAVPVNVLRPFNLYGPLMDINDGRIIPNICKAMLEGENFSVYGNGKQTRTYCYATDAMVYMFSVLLSDNFGKIYNIGSDDEELSASGLAEVVYGFMEPKNSHPIISEYPDDYPNQEPSRRCPDISKIKNLSGYLPQYSLSQGFRSCYDFFKAEYY